jgi:hypothetical protein
VRHLLRGVVDQDVHPAEFGDGSVDDGPAVLGVR